MKNFGELDLGDEDLPTVKGSDDLPTLVNSNLPVFRGASDYPTPKPYDLPEVVRHCNLPSLAPTSLPSLAEEQNLPTTVIPNLPALVDTALPLFKETSDDLPTLKSERPIAIELDLPPVSSAPDSKDLLPLGNEVLERPTARVIGPTPIGFRTKTITKPNSVRWWGLALLATMGVGVGTVYYMSPAIHPNLAQIGLQVPVIKIVLTSAKASEPDAKEQATEAFANGLSLLEKQPIAARLAFEEALLLDAHTGNYALYASVAALRSNDVRLAEYHLRHAQILETTGYLMEATHGEILLRQGQALDARKHFELAIDDKSNYAPGYAGLALSYDDSSEWRQAEFAWRKALALEPEQADWHFRLGQLLIRTNRDAEAVEELRLAILYHSSFSQRAEELIHSLR